METISFRLGIDHYIYYNEPTSRNTCIYKKKIPTEIKNSKTYNIGEKNE